MNRLHSWMKGLDRGLEHLLFDRVFTDRRRGLAGLAVALAMAVALGSSLVGSSPPVTQDMVSQYLRDRPWLDEIPMNPTPDNPCHAYYFQKEEGRGVYITFLSRYRQEMELFFYKMRGTDQIEIFLPESKKKAAGSITIQEVSKGQFDLKLHLSNDPKVGGDADYWSFKQWDAAAGVPRSLEDLGLPTRP